MGENFSLVLALATAVVLARVTAFARALALLTALVLALVTAHNHDAVWYPKFVINIPSSSAHVCASVARLPVTFRKSSVGFRADGNRGKLVAFRRGH